MNEIWFKYEAETDEEPSHEANVTLSEDGFNVAWSHTAVGQVTNVEFDTLADAYDWLQEQGYVYMGKED